MHSRTLALSFAALSLVAIDAQAGPTDTLKIATAKVRSVSNGRLNLKLGLYTRGGRSQHPVEVYYVRGRERVRLHQGNATFSGTRGGFETGVAVNLGRRNLNKARLEVIVPACKAQRARDCVKKISLGGGANLAFDGRNSFERRGSDTLIKLKIKNTGVARGSKCKLSFKIDGKRHGGSNLIPALNPNQKHDVTIRYPGRLKGKRFEAKLQCRDMIRGDNSRTGSLK